MSVVIDRKPAARFIWCAILLSGAAACLAAGAAFAGATYSYDELGRVISVRYSDGKQIVYKYDAAGNRTQHVVSATTVNRAPVAGGDAITLPENLSTVTFDPRVNDTDPDGNPLSIFGLGGAGEFGAFAVNGTTSVTYSSTFKRNATDRVVYSITDGQGMNAGRDRRDASEFAAGRRDGFLFDGAEHRQDVRPARER